VLCLNTATIRGQKLGLVKEIEVAAKAGYQAIEPWVASIEAYQKEGGSLPDLKRRIAEHNKEESFPPKTKGHGSFTTARVMAPSPKQPTANAKSRA